MTLFHTCCETLHRSGGGEEGENEGEWEEDSSGGLIGHCVSPQPWREIDAHVIQLHQRVYIEESTFVIACSLFPCDHFTDAVHWLHIQGMAIHSALAPVTTIDEQSSRFVD